MRVPTQLEELRQDGIIDDVLCQLKSGKEADVYVVEIDQKSKFDFFSDFQRFQDFHRARSAHPLGTPTRPCRPVHRDSPTKKSLKKVLKKKS